MARTQRWFLRNTPGRIARAGDAPEAVWAKRLNELEEDLGVKYHDQKLLALALTHSSSITGAERRFKSDNERLEFLGDAVLELIITHLIYVRKPDCDEGQLTQIRSALVNTNALASQAKSLNLPEYVRLGKGESESGGAFKNSINANTFEAILGSLYMDQGWEVSFKFIENHFIDQIDAISDEDETKDPKSLLQEISLNRHGCLPRYVVVGQRTRDKDRVFQVKVLLNNELIAIGRGRSKKSAEQEAATLALSELKVSV